MSNFQALFDLISMNGSALTEWKSISTLSVFLHSLGALKELSIYLVTKLTSRSKSVNITSINITLDWIISGARYSGVPHKVHVLSVIFFAKPKSVICKSLCLILRKDEMFGFPHLQVAFLVQQQVLRLHVPIKAFLLLLLCTFSLTLSATCRWWRGSEDTQGRTQSQRRRRRRWGRRTSQSWATSWRINIQAAKMTKWIFMRMMMSVFCCEPPKNLPPQSNSIPRMTLIWTKYTETCHHLLGKPPKRENMIK